MTVGNRFIEVTCMGGLRTRILVNIAHIRWVERSGTGSVLFLSDKPDDDCAVAVQESYDLIKQKLGVE